VSRIQVPELRVWLEVDRCQGNVSHNWERKWRSLRFLEAVRANFSRIVLKILGLMFGMEIAIRADVREGRFL
jgi:hypothetical protein